MNYEKFSQEITANGFEIEYTGGGCSAWVYERPDGCVVWVHQDLRHAIDEELLPTPDGAVEVGISRDFGTIRFTLTHSLREASRLAVGYINEEVTA